jgi:hypothetical protein
MANTSFSGPVRSQNGFQGYSPDAAANNSLTLSAQGTGVVINTSSVPFFQLTATTVSTAGAVTYTAAQLKTGMILRDPNGAARADLFPTAADLLAAVPGAIVGTSFIVTIRNTADAAETITMTTNTGLTLSGTMTIAQNEQKSFLVTFTNVGTAAVTIYSMGSVTF